VTDLIPDPGRVSARRTLTREKLMTAAVTAFAERGIVGASVEEICETAGFTRGAFYSNFTDKDALVLALIQQNIQAQYAAAERAVAVAKSAPDDLTAAELVTLTLDRFDVIGGQGREAITTQQELLLHAARQPALREPYMEFADACTRQLTTLITEALVATRLEFTVPFAEAIELLMATHAHVQRLALFTGQHDPQLMRTLIMAITRPV